MSTLGLIIGRFQPFHKGHALLVEASQKENIETLILIGSSQKQDLKNPWSYQQRKEIIESNGILESTTISDLPDSESDKIWVESICSHIPSETKTVHLYCGDTQNDSAVRVLLEFKNTLPFEIKICEIPRAQLPISGTQIREILTNQEKPNFNTLLSPETILYLENLEKK